MRVQVYVSKSNLIEIEYDVVLDKLAADGKLNDVQFQIKYEFVERGCEHLMVPSLKTEQKGKIIYLRKTQLGTQSALSKLISIDYHNLTSGMIFFYN